MYCIISRFSPIKIELCEIREYRRFDYVLEVFSRFFLKYLSISSEMFKTEHFEPWQIMERSNKFMSVIPWNNWGICNDPWRKMSEEATRMSQFFSVLYGCVVFFKGVYNDTSKLFFNDSNFKLSSLLIRRIQTGIRNRIIFLLNDFIGYPVVVVIDRFFFKSRNCENHTYLIVHNLKSDSTTVIYHRYCLVTRMTANHFIWAVLNLFIHITLGK